MNEDTTSDTLPASVDKPVDFKLFLEDVHPSVEKRVSFLWNIVKHPNGTRSSWWQTPELRLFCEVCSGERTFRATKQYAMNDSGSGESITFSYLCGDCRKQRKLFSLYLSKSDEPLGSAYKYGELPSFGVPVPAKVLRLFGKDGRTFLKGRQCENQGMGVGAFAYYRRVVENHKNDIFEEIIKVCQTLEASPALIDELRNAKKEVSFRKAIEKIKLGLPQGLLINGCNPLTLLHGALSLGLHSETDENCLATAAAVRLVLTDLVEKAASLRQDNRELQDAVRLLMQKRLPE